MWLKDERWPFARKPPWNREDVPEILRWVAEHLRETSGGQKISAASPVAALKEKKLLAEIRKIEALADGAEFDNRERDRLVIPADEVASIGARAFGVFKSAMMGLPSTIVPRLQGRDAAEQQDILETEIKNALSELADDLRKVGIADDAPKKAKAQ